MTSIFGGGAPKTQYVPLATPAPVVPAPVAPPVVPGAPPVAPTVQAPATAPLPAQVTAAGNQTAATIAQRAGRSSTVLTTRTPRGTQTAGNYGGGSIGAASSGSASPYAAKTLG